MTARIHIDMFYPQVGVATVELLERLGPGELLDLRLRLPRAGILRVAKICCPLCRVFQPGRPS